MKTTLTRRLGLLGVSLAALALSQGVRAEDAIEHIKTASPIKHVIIIVGENRSFDHLFATYVPKSRDERVLNLLSEHIVKADGSPDENFDQGASVSDHLGAEWRKVLHQRRQGQQDIVHHAAGARSRWRAATAPAAGVLGIPGGDPGLPAADQFLFGTGGTGLPNT